MRKITFAVIHYTYSPDFPALVIRLWHKAKGWKDIGYHKVIRKNGLIEEGRPESQIGAHTGGRNKFSLGVVLTGSNLLSWYPSDAQYQSLNKVLKDWMKRFNIPKERIYFHRELTSTSCPGRLDKNKIMQMLVFPKPEIKEEDMQKFLHQITPNHWYHQNVFKEHLDKEGKSTRIYISNRQGMGQKVDLYFYNRNILTPITEHSTTIKAHNTKIFDLKKHKPSVPKGVGLEMDIIGENPLLVGYDEEG